jgi:hypothetical protein
MATTTPLKDISLDRRCPDAPARRHATRRSSLDGYVRAARFRHVATALVAAFERVEEPVERRCPDAPARRRAVPRSAQDDCVRAAQLKPVATNLVAAFGCVVEDPHEQRCPGAPVKAQPTLRRRPGSPSRCPGAPKKVQAMRRRPASPPPCEAAPCLLGGRPPLYPR